MHSFTLRVSYTRSKHVRISYKNETAYTDAFIELYSFGLYTTEVLYELDRNHRNMLLSSLHKFLEKEEDLTSFYPPSSVKKESISRVLIWNIHDREHGFSYSEYGIWKKGLQEDLYVSPLCYLASIQNKYKEDKENMHRIYSEMIKEIILNRKVLEIREEMYNFVFTAAIKIAHDFHIPIK